MTMPTIEERARLYSQHEYPNGDIDIKECAEHSYYLGAYNQHKIDIDKLKTILNQLMIDTKDKAEIIKMMEQ